MLGIVECDEIEVAPVPGKPSVKTDEDGLDKADSGIYDENGVEKTSDRKQMDCESDDDEPVVRRKTKKKSFLTLSDDESCDVTEDKEGQEASHTKDAAVPRKLTTEEALAQVTNEQSDEDKRDGTDCDEDKISLSAVLSKKKKSRIKMGSFLENDEDHDSRSSANGSDKQDENKVGKMTFDSTIFDAETDSDDDGDLRKQDNSDDGSCEESSDDESNKSGDDEGYSEQEELPISDKLKARLKKGAAKKPSTRKQKKAEMEERQEVHSESQRLIRESRVNIPYHEPKPKPLSDFLTSAAQKQSALKTLKGAAGFRSISWYEEKERERKKQEEEKKERVLAAATKDNKCVVDKESEEVSVSAIGEPAAGKVVLQKVAKKLSLLEEDDFDTLPDLVVEVDSNNEELRAETMLSVDLTEEELPDIVSEPVTLEMESTLVNTECTVAESGCVQGSVVDPVGVESSCADVSLNTSSVQLFEDPEEGAFATVISLDECVANTVSNTPKTEKRNRAENPVTNNPVLRTEHVDLTSVCSNENTSANPNLKALSVADLRTLTPKLSGSPHMVISLDDEDGQQTPTNPGVVSLMSRFLQHSKKKKPQQSKDHNISIVQREAGADQKEDLKLTTVVYHSELQEEPLSQYDTPGAKLLALKEQLSAQMRVKREEARQKRVELYQLDNEEGYEERAAEEEEEAEMTDGSDTEDQEEDVEYKPGDQISGAEEEDEEVDEEEREVNPFAEEEAEDDGDEMGDDEDKVEADEPVSDEDSESLKLALSDEEDTMREDKHDDDMDEDMIKPCQKVKKLRALAISDDEESRDVPVEKHKDDVERTAEAPAENEKDVSFGEDCMTPFTKHITSATPPESWVCKNRPRPLSLPIEDSQDLYSNSVGESSQHSQLAPSESQSLHFLSEDTQSQMLDADGFLKVNSTLKKPKHKPASLLGPSLEDSTMDELLGLCSGRFGEPSQTVPPPGDKKTSRNLFSQPEMDDDNAHTGDMEELLRLCSGRFSDSTQIRSSQKRGIKRRPGADDADSDLDSDASFTFLSDEEDKENRDDKTEPFSDEEEMAGNQQDDDSALMPAPKFKGFTVGKKKGARRIRAEFVEDEAELSGSEYDSDENLDIPEEEDILMEEEGDKDVSMSEEELRNQVGRVHMKNLMDQDHREMVRLQEMYLPDGDLHSDGKGRTRRFRWNYIDDTQEDMFGAGSDDEGAGEEEGEADSKWRMERHEREKWLQEQQEKDEVDDSNSQFVKFGKMILKQKNKPVPEEESNRALSSNSDEVKKDKANLPKLAMPSNMTMSQKRGSFLSRGKDKLAKIAELTKPGVNTNAARTSKNFVFKPLSPEAEGKKPKANSQPQASYSIPSGSQPPSAKRQKTMSASSFSQNSIFNHLH